MPSRSATAVDDKAEDSLRQVREGSPLPRELPALLAELDGRLREIGFRLNRALPKDGTESISEFVEFTERASDPAAPAANGARLFAKDNGAGKTQLAVRFATGAVQIVATEP
jgi:hypothetical protein